MNDEPTELELVDDDRLDRLVAALAALTDALAPVVSPATRPTWDQQRWSPGPDAFGPDELAAPGPTAAADANGFPAIVVADALIESAWGNTVRTKLYDALGGAASPAFAMRFGMAVYGTNGNGDALITFSPPFPASMMCLIAVDATQGIDQPLVCKTQNSASNPSTGIVRVWAVNGSKVLNNGSLVLAWVAWGR